MSFLDDDRLKKPAAAQLGENLADLSIGELHARVELYRAEIARLEREIQAKEKSRSAAESFFRSEARQEK